MTCGSCRHAARRADGLLVCRRYPPLPLVAAGGHLVGARPVVEPGDSCGEWGAVTLGSAVIESRVEVQTPALARAWRALWGR